MTPVKPYLSGVVLHQQQKEPAFTSEILLHPRVIQRVIPDMTPYSDIDSATPDDIISAAKRAEIIDERDGKELFRKLMMCTGKNAFILVDALDDEPYISSQMGPMIHLSDECIGGLRLVQKAVDSNNADVLVYRSLNSLDTRIPFSVGGVPVRKVGGKYPADGQKNSLVKRKGVLYVYIGACALIHLYRAVYGARMHTTAFVTVAGNCITRPRNVEVNMGVSVQEVLDFCGLSDTPTRVVVGGSMTGQAIKDTEKTRITATTRGILALKEDENDKKYICIGCGRCVEGCPVGLNPMMIYKALKKDKYIMAENLGRGDCIGCMTCSYLCPAKLNLGAEIFLEDKNGKE